MVNKSHRASCALGADYSLEQVNQWMKVAGITQNQTARKRFFLEALKLGRLKVESKQNANTEQKLSAKHYELSNAARNKLYLSALSLTTTLQASTKPIHYDGEDFINT